MTKEILKQALEALESDNPYLRQLAANTIFEPPFVTPPAAQPEQQAEPVAEKQQLQSELFQLAVSRGLITIRTERLDDRNVNTEVSWMQGHFVACDISNEAAHNIKEGT
jgi:hypothetical protein